MSVVRSLTPRKRHSGRTQGWESSWETGLGVTKPHCWGPGEGRRKKGGQEGRHVPGSWAGKLQPDD